MNSDFLFKKTLYVKLAASLRSLALESLMYDIAKELWLLRQLQQAEESHFHGLQNREIFSHIHV